MIWAAKNHYVGQLYFRIPTLKPVPKTCLEGFDLVLLVDLVSVEAESIFRL